ncbi:MAG: methyl-accepting chemotaxis protein [Treponema sp.]|nr:methyl-accepting chemotaxis protein [Treponema sp.]MCL2237207.1 methyl-accepting chemotaxis protein [Treponema sp.]
MIFSKLKISKKFIISSAVFLIPIVVMLFFICSLTIGKIQKSTNEYRGINAIKPAVALMQTLPRYFELHLELQQGDIRDLYSDITNAVRTFDRNMEYYNKNGADIPVLFPMWENLRSLNKNDPEIFDIYLAFVNTLNSCINRIGQYSSLILVSDMETYNFIALTITSIPEASSRFFSLGNSIRKGLFSAEDIIARWNADVATALAGGTSSRRRQIYEGLPENLPVNMLDSAEQQVIRNNRILIESDKERIKESVTRAIEGDIKKTEDLGELASRLDRYLDSSLELNKFLAGQQRTQTSSPVLTASDFLKTLAIANNDLCSLWDETFKQLGLQIHRNIWNARWQLIVYLFIVLISLSLSIWFVILITRDINKSVINLKSLFKSLNENDLTLSLKANSMDEFGELTIAFNGFLNVLRSTLGSFKQSTQLVADSVFDISSSSKEITTTANQQSASVSEIVSTMEGSKNLSEQIAFKTSEVAKLAIETQNLSSKGAELREANQVMMEEIIKQNQKIITEIRSLSDMIIRISEAIRIIDSIADQTKLIAFNASLEASSSGETGTRFSVVASEIRRFADNVADSTKEIKQKIEEVQRGSQILIAEANSGSKQIEVGYERMSEQKIVFENIVDNSQNVAAMSQQISNLSKQQELASSQIFIALKEISAGVKQFVIATSSTSKIADNLNVMSVDLKGKVEKYKTEN